MTSHRRTFRSAALSLPLCLVAAAGCESGGGSRDADRPARGDRPGMNAGSDGSAGAAAAEPPDLAVAVDRLELRDVDLEVEGLTADLSLNLSFLGIVTAEVRLDAGAERLKLKVGELLADVAVDARLGVLLEVIQDIVTLFEENPDLLQRLQLRMRMGEVTGGGTSGTSGSGVGGGGTGGSSGSDGGGSGGSGGDAPVPTPAPS